MKNGLGWDTHDSLIGLLPPTSQIKISSGVDRYGFSSVLANRCGRRMIPRSFANWIHGWIWADTPTAELLGCAKLPKKLTLVVRNKIEKDALEAENFMDIRVGGLPFAYIEQQHIHRHKNSLLAFPAHSAEAELVSYDQAEYLDYLHSLKQDFESIYLSIYYLDMGGPLHKAANARGLRVLQGARPDDANSLLRVRSMLDSFTYVTSNVMGSHMLYSVFAGCNFSFSGPMYGYDESVFLANGNPHGHSSDRIRLALQLQSESYLRDKFPNFFVAHPRAGIQDASFARDAIGAEWLMNPQQVEDALGWNLRGQIDGYLAGALRRTSRLFGR
jgi:hypothetical protein